MDARKKVLLIGANGNIGQYITKHLIKHFQVRALIRSPPRFGINSIFLKFVQGDATDPDVLKQHLEGIDIVVASFRGDPASHDYERFTETLISAMNAKVYMSSKCLSQGVKRFITVAGAGCLNTAEQERLADSPHFPGIYKSVSEDHWAGVKKLQTSGLDYTVICPPAVTLEEHDGQYEVTAGTYTHGVNKFEVKGGNIGHFVAQQAQNNAYLKQMVGIFQKQ